MQPYPEGSKQEAQGQNAALDPNEVKTEPEQGQKKTLPAKKQLTQVHFDCAFARCGLSFRESL